MVEENMDVRGVRKRVQKGMELLDRHFGRKWVDRIDLQRLNIQHGDDCAMGQLFRVQAGAIYNSGFQRGVKILEVELPAELGFSVKAPGRQLVEPEYELLTQVWKAEIGLRRNGTIPLPHIPPDTAELTTELENQEVLATV